MIINLIFRYKLDYQMNYAKVKAKYYSEDRA